MDEEDAEKMTFIIPRGVYCYKMIPFGLKNAEATYMKAMTTIFHDMIHKEIEVYVDDVIIKCKRTAGHIEYLRKFFDRLRRYNLKLNPTKCALEVPPGKLLGFIAVKEQALADHLAENPVGGTYEPLKTYYPDEGVSFMGEDITETYDGWRMFFDGAANFKGVRIKAVLVSETGQHYPIAAKLRFPCTNNMTEYEACILGLNMAVDMNIQELSVIGDLDLLVHRVEAASYKVVTKKVITDFIKDRIVCRVSVPESIIIDNTTNMNSDLMKAMFRTSTGTTPYMLVYGTEAVIPTEVEIPSLRVIQEAELNDAEWIRSRYEQLALIDGKRMNFVYHG
ncbi:uncharacterized protein [Nicotiana sylvestris]|uniref:uncharacterized protein n=1 Tax=Nicotiana sylvestris TaxID=4096 RepID=UPI00388C5148